MDCTSILLEVPFFITRKATIIPYLGRCDIEKEGKRFILNLVPVPRSTSLVSTLKGKQVIQAQRKFVLIAEGKEEEPKIVVDQAYQQYFLVGEIRVPSISMSMGSILIGRMRVPMLGLDRKWQEMSYGMDQAMGSIASPGGRN